MLKVFLVEDETVIRNGIKKGIQWEKEGMEFVGEAPDGEMAYPLILQLKPDILITDIKMPFMDGLELSQAVLKELPDTKIMILSGYGEFGYAQKALRIGVQEYLLKPVSSAKLVEALKGLCRQIEKEKEEKEVLFRHSEEMEEQKQRKIQNFFKRLIIEQLSPEELLAERKSLGIDLAAESYNIVLLKLRWKGRETEYSLEVVNTENEIRRYVSEREDVYLYERGAEGFGFFLKGEYEENMLQKIREFCSRIINLTNAYEEVEYYIGVGKIVTGLGELKESYYEANRVFSRRFAGKWNRIIYQEDFVETVNEKLEIQNLYAVENIRKLVRQFLRKGTLDEVESFIQGYFGNISRENLKSLLMRQYICMDIYLSVIAFGEEIKLPQEEVTEACGEVMELAEHIENIDKMILYIEKILKNILLLRDGAAGRKYSDILLKACTYIKENYMQEDMSLNKVSSYVNMSPSYFSSIFSQEAGKTFVEYLTEVRIEKSKELLMCSNQKITEIGFQVGYKDSHYFNYLFKKTQKCSPREYRARGKKLE